MRNRHGNSNRKIETGIAVTCECLKCGYTVRSNAHCMSMKCPKCGGAMRRSDRPGRGR